MRIQNLSLFVLLSSCSILQNKAKIDSGLLALPSLKNSPNECYYLDEFMPVPNNVVTGRNGSMNLRYYTYHSAQYKDWNENDVILSFYSKDNRCWSLFEEYAISY